MADMMTLLLLRLCLLQGHKNTSAALRGQQLIDVVQGKTAGEQVHAGESVLKLLKCILRVFFVISDSLVDKHDFHNTLQDTVSNLSVCLPVSLSDLLFCFGYDHHHD